MGRLHPLVPSITSFVAFLLGMLCLFAGTQRQCLPKADLLTLHLDNMTVPIPGAPDFFSVYVMSYCEGVTEECEEDGTNETSTVTTIRSCSDRDVLFSFNPTDALATALGKNPGSSWPSFLSDDFDVLAPTSRTMAVFYVIGTAMAGVSLFIKPVQTWIIRSPEDPGDSPPSALQFMAVLASTLSLGVSSLLGSVIASEFVGLLNQSGAPLGISASHGSAFLGMSWTAVVLQTIGTIDQLVMMLMYRARQYDEDWDDEPMEEPLVEKPQEMPGDGPEDEDRHDYRNHHV